MQLHARARSCLLALVSACAHAPSAPTRPATSPAPAPSADRAAQPAPTPLVVGETFRLDSRILGERRVINVYLPPGYREGTERYPVLYMPDGGVAEDFPHIMGIVDVSIKNQVIRPMIVVGIENTERRRDLVGPTTVAEDQKIAPHAGGADHFRAFLRDELKPFVAARYRTTGASAIVGESFAGLFVVETLLVEPALFDSYIAIDPSLWWNAGSLVRGAAARLAAWSAGPKTLYLATGDLKPMQDAAGALVDALRTAQPGQVAWHYLPLPDEHHNTIYPVAALRAFRTLFAAASRS